MGWSKKWSYSNFLLQKCGTIKFKFFLRFCCVPVGFSRGKKFFQNFFPLENPIVAAWIETEKLIFFAATCTNIGN